MTTTYLEEQSSIIKNYSVLREDYVPEQIDHRKDQLDSLKLFVFHGPTTRRPSSHIFLQGTPGTGKSLCVIYMKEQLENYFNTFPAKLQEFPTKVLYLNSKIFSTPAAVAMELAGQFRAGVKTGFSINEYLSMFFSEIDKQYDSVIIILDEVDRLIGKGADMADVLLYQILRAREMRLLKRTYVSLVCIANDTRIREKLSPGTQSSMGMNWVHFPRYTTQQLTDILRKRATNAMQEFTIEEDVVQAIAAYSNEIGSDCRQAIGLLRVTAELAEKEGKQKIDLGFFKKAKELFEKEMVKQEMTDMSFHEKLVFYALASYCFKFKKTPDITLLYKIYYNLAMKVKQETIQERMIRNYLKEMVAKNLVEEFFDTGKLYYKPIIDPKTTNLLLEEFYNLHQVKADEFLKEREGEIKWEDRKTYS